MKSLAISLTLFFILISVVIINAIYINEESCRLTDLARKLEAPDSPDFESRFAELENSWQNFRRIADISCSHSELSKIDLTIREIKTHAATHSLGDYEAACNMLILLLEDLSRLEKISIHGLI